MFSQAEFDDIHNSVMDAMDYVMLPVTLYVVATNQATDPLYGEAVGGKETRVALRPIQASVRERPGEELLTRIGARTNTDLLVFIPRGVIIAWEAATQTTFAPTLGMDLKYQGVCYSLNREPRTDALPTDSTKGYDYIGMVLTAAIKSDTGR